MNIEANTRRLSALRHLSVRLRLAIGFGSVVALLAVSAVLGVWELNSLAQTLDRLEGRDLAVERLVSEWRMATQVNQPRVLAVTLSSEAELSRLFAAQIEKSSREISALQQELEGLLDSPQEKEALVRVVERRRAYLAARDEVLQVRKAGNADNTARRARETLVPAVDAYATSQTEFARTLAAQRSARTANAQQSADAGRWLLIAFAALGTAAALLMGGMIATSIHQPVSRAIQVAELLATGNLRERIAVRSRSEFGRMLGALEAMRVQFTQSLNSVLQATRVVGQEAKEVARGSAELATRTEEQASSLEQTAAAMEEFAATVRHGADDAQQASELARRAADIAARGGTAVSAVVGTMNGISESSRRITDIVAVIDGIAFQTNILALNAAVEAARAGEQGRGFAVVATEVRALAHRSATAAKEIKTLIGDTANRVDEGARQVEHAGQTMGELVSSVKQVADLIEAISLSGMEQLSGIEQVSLAVAQLDRVTQQNAALVSSSASAAENMAHQADALDEAVAHFQIEVRAPSMPDLGNRLPVPPLSPGRDRAALSSAR